MRTKKLLALAAMATIVLSSCNNNDDMAPVNVLPEDGVIRVTAGVGELISRAGADNSTMSEFGLFVTNSVVSGYTYENICMKKQAGAWKSYESDGSTSKLMLWNKSDQEVSVIAYAPYNSAAVKSSSVQNSVNIDQSVAVNVVASDFLYAANNVTPSAPITTNDIFYETGAKSLTVKMNHKLSKLRINVKYGTELTQNGATPVLGDVTLTNTNTNYTIDLASGTVRQNTGLTNIANIKMFHETTPITGFDVTYEAIIVPQLVDFNVKLMVNNKEYIYKYTNRYNFESGKLYRLDLTVGKDVVIPDNFSSSEWINGTGADLETE